MWQRWKEPEEYILPMVIKVELDAGGKLELIQLEDSTDERIFNEFQQHSREIEEELQATRTYLLLFIILYFFYFWLFILFVLEEVFEEMGIEVKRQEEPLDRMEGVVEESSQAVKGAVYELYSVCIYFIFIIFF